MASSLPTAQKRSFDDVDTSSDSEGAAAGSSNKRQKTVLDDVGNFIKLDQKITVECRVDGGPTQMGWQIPTAPAPTALPVVAIAASSTTAVVDLEIARIEAKTNHIKAVSELLSKLEQTTSNEKLAMIGLLLK